MNAPAGGDPNRIFALLREVQETLEGETSPMELATKLGSLRGVMDRGYFRLETLCLQSAGETRADGRNESGDRMLTAAEAAQLLSTTPRWLYRHGPKLPFSRRLSRRQLRFSEAGLRRWLERQKGTQA